jgi:hypothetical protein
VDRVVVVQRRDQLLDLLLRRVGRQPVVDRAHPGVLGRLALVAHVHVRGGVVAHEDRGQAGLVATAVDPLGHLARDALLHLGGHRAAVDHVVVHLFSRGA